MFPARMSCVEIVSSATTPSARRTTAAFTSSSASEMATAAGMSTSSPASEPWASTSDRPAASRNPPRSAPVSGIVYVTGGVVVVRTGSRRSGIGTGTRVAVTLEWTVTSRFSLRSTRTSAVPAKRP